MKVAQVVCTDAFAGAERYVTTLANGLAEQGCDVVVLGGSEPRMKLELHSSVVWRQASNMHQAALALMRLGHIDVVHAHMTLAETAASLTKFRWGGKLVTTRHFAAVRGKTLGGRIASVGIIRRSIDVQVAISHFVAEHIDGPSTVVHSGVDEIVNLEPRCTRQSTILVAQRFEKEKQTKTALCAFAASQLVGSGWELHLAGTGSEEEELRHVAEEIGVSGACRWLGLVNDLDRRLLRTGLFLATAPAEPFGLSVVEAMAAGAPVVAAAGGGHLETVGASSGAAMFPPGDYSAAGQLLAGLAADSVARRAYGDDLRIIQREKFDSRRMVQQIAEIYGMQTIV